tara:strand:+ start:399 stop:1313 length:915 start_codon:yes stop_codon:yes gene_type:complete
MSNGPGDSGQPNEPNQGTNDQLAAILAANAQPQPAGEGTDQPTQQQANPQTAAGRNREQTTDDSENIDPGSPQASAGRSREQTFDDSENIDPSSDVLQSLLDGGGAGGAGGGDDVKSMSRRAGEAAGHVAMFGTAALAANVGLTKLSTTTIRLNESLAEWNGEIARAAGLARAAQIERQIQQGATIGGAHARLSEANQEYRDMMTDIMSPLQSAGLNISASVLEMRNWAVGVVAPTLTQMSELMDWMVKNWWFGEPEDDPTAIGARAFLSDLSDGKFDGVGTSYMNAGNRPLMSDADRTRIFGP